MTIIIHKTASQSEYFLFLSISFLFFFQVKCVNSLSFLLLVDYDEKAEDAIDYEDIDEQYDGPEIQSATEEDHLLPKKDYISSNSFLASLDQKGSVFDEENYDEDEETIKENEVVENNIEVKSENNIEVKSSPSAGYPLNLSVLFSSLPFLIISFSENCKCFNLLTIITQ